MKKSGDFMFLEQLGLLNFRNYDSLSLKLSKNINIFYGKNAQGKTNILESIYYLALTKSYRTREDNNLLKYNKRAFKVQGLLNKDNIKNKYSVRYDNKGKKYFIDDNEYKKLYEYISNINVITFTPDDIEILKGIPDIRRKYIDNELSQLYNAYYKVNNEYKKILKMRNDILKNYSVTHQMDNSYFNILTQYLIDRATFIYRAREKFIRKLNEEINIIYEKIINISDFHIEYKNQLSTNEYTNDNIKKILESMYKENYKQELSAGTTLFGPHRDDYEFYLKNDNLKNKGSQGQQKLSILTIKLAELTLFKKQSGSYPILLLDDVFSEFDKEKIANILKFVNEEMQVIITSTDVKQIRKSILDKAKLFNVDNGKIIEMKR